MFRNVDAQLVPAVQIMIADSLRGWADSMSVDVEHVAPEFRGKIVVDNRRRSKQDGKAAKNTMTFAQLQNEIAAIDAKAAKANAKQAEQTEQARRAELYAAQFQEKGSFEYEDDSNPLFMKQLEFVAMLVQEKGFDPDFFTEDE